MFLRLARASSSSTKPASLSGTAPSLGVALLAFGIGVRAAGLSVLVGLGWVVFGRAALVGFGFMCLEALKIDMAGCGSLVTVVGLSSVDRKRSYSRGSGEILISRSRSRKAWVWCGQSIARIEEVARARAKQ